MVDYSRYRPRNRSYRGMRAGGGKKNWRPIALVVAYLTAIGVGCLLSAH